MGKIFAGEQYTGQGLSVRNVTSFIQAEIRDFGSIWIAILKWSF